MASGSGGSPAGSNLSALSSFSPFLPFQQKLQIMVGIGCEFQSSSSSENEQLNEVKTEETVGEKAPEQNPNAERTIKIGQSEEHGAKRKASSGAGGHGFSIDDLLTGQKRRRKNETEDKEEQGRREAKVPKREREQSELLLDKPNSKGSAETEQQQLKQPDENWQSSSAPASAQHQLPLLLHQPLPIPSTIVTATAWQHLNALFMHQSGAVEQLLALARARERESMATAEEAQQQQRAELKNRHQQQFALSSLLLDQQQRQHDHNVVIQQPNPFAAFLDAQQFSYPSNETPCSRRNSLHGEDVSPLGGFESEDDDPNGREISDEDGTAEGENNSPNGADSPTEVTGRKKKTRTVFSRNQVGLLEEMFNKQKYLTSQQRSQLAVNLKLSETQVKIWFQNRRNKWKRMAHNGELASESVALPAANHHHLQTAVSQSQMLSSSFPTPHPPLIQQFQQQQQRHQLALALAGLNGVPASVLLDPSTVFNQQSEPASKQQNGVNITAAQQQHFLLEEKEHQQSQFEPNNSPFSTTPTQSLLPATAAPPPPPSSSSSASSSAVPSSATRFLLPFLPATFLNASSSKQI